MQSMLEAFLLETKCDIKGRIQSRQYVKYGENGEPEYRTAYEISVQTVGVEEK